MPVSLLPLPLYVLLWGPATALLHCAYLLLGGAALVELLMRGFVKMPYASAVQPGRGNLRVKFGAWVGVFSFLCWWAAVIEEDVLRRARGRLYALGILLCVWLLLAGLRLLRDRGRAPVFEEPQHQDLDLLRLHA